MAKEQYVEAVYWNGRWYAYNDTIYSNSDLLSAYRQNGTAYRPVDEVYTRNNFGARIKYYNTGQYMADKRNGLVVSNIPEGAATDININNDLDKDITSNAYLDSLMQQAYKNYANLNVDPNSAQSQQYLNDMYASINREQAEVEAALSNAEVDAYRQIGYQQQQLENQIAENRLKAIKSGTTSAQLAAQQLNNMFAAQTGAAEIAANAMNTRINNAQNYATQRSAVTDNLYNQLMQNRTTLATAGAQNAAAGLSYASYVNKQLADLQANNYYYTKLGEDGYNTLLGK